MSDPWFYNSFDAQPRDWYLDYSHRDRELVDYQSYELPAAPGIKFRGPAVPAPALASGGYFSCLGAAQTMGVYVQRPYPAILSERIGLPSLNLGLGGAGPGFYLLHDKLLEIVNRGRFVILQVMSARAESNSRLAPSGFVETVRDRKTGVTAPSISTWLRLLNEERDQLPRFIEESRDSYRRRYRDLLARIKVPVILFYFSPKPQDEAVNFSATTVNGLMGRFPQLVDRSSVDALRRMTPHYCECSSARNMNYLHVSRFTGKPVVIDHGDLMESQRGHLEERNDYYPSPEMHEDAVNTLLPCLEQARMVPAGAGGVMQDELALD